MEVDVDRLKSHLQELARTPRPANSEPLERARRYVVEQFQQAGWSVEPISFNPRFDGTSPLQGINLVAQHPQFPLTNNGPRFCVGAHLDSIPTSPGADDNATAVATLLEIARLLPSSWPESPQLELELVAFDLEEVGMLGGAEHARRAQAANVDLRGMISLEMLGYCDHAPNSQNLPAPLAGMYPDTANFIAVVGNQNSGVLIEQFSHAMKRVPELPVETLAVPNDGNDFQATRLSDHSPFWDAGFPALMITDTSFFRNPHYHMPTDTPDTIDMIFLTRVADGCLEAVRHILETGLELTRK